MMMRQSLILLSAISLALAGLTNGSVKKGDVEIEFSGGWVMEKTETGNTEGPGGSIDWDPVFAGATGADLDSWMVMLGLSRFATDNLQLGVAGFYTQMEGDTESFEPIDDLIGEFDLDLTAFGVGGRARWHFNPTGQWVPYLGVQAFWVSADIDVEATVSVTGSEDPLLEGSESDSPSGILWGPVAGLRLELGEQDALLLEYQYHFWAGDISDVIENGHGFFVGLSHRMK
jgi:hypothetical protein